MEAEQYPLSAVPNARLSLGGQPFADSMSRAEDLVRSLYAKAATAVRSSLPLSKICFAQQCGGSDAFSGISANPLAGYDLVLSALKILTAGSQMART